MLSPEPPRMVADIGGTNTRLALYDPALNQLSHLRTFTNSDHSSLESIIDFWLGSLNKRPPRRACLAIAAPPGTDPVTMVNSKWAFSIADLAKRFGFERSRRVNDFEAIAHSLPHLGPGDLYTLHPATAAAPGPLATIGPGTGLGGATLDTRGEEPGATACEPGHTGLSPGNATELRVFQSLLVDYPDIYTELLVSGPGLVRLYECLGSVMGLSAQTLTPAAVSQSARDGDPLSVAALNCFCSLLGSACGDFVLANGAYGGLYLAGGIVPGIIPFITDSDFHRRFCGKGAMRDRLNAVSVYVITHSQPGLLGAARISLDR